MRTYSSLLLLLVGLTVAPGPAAWQQQPPRQGTAAISGVVRNGATGRPVARAVVALRSSGGGPLARIVRQLTDEQGRFVFRDLAAFDGYTLSATKIGYVDGSYGQSALLGPAGAVPVADGQWFDQADILLWKPGAIAGRVVDERHEPLVGVYVRALAQQHIAGQPKLVGGPVATTDDRGEYRIAGLPPGRYLIYVPSAQNTVPVGMPAGETLERITSSDTLTRQIMFTSLGNAPRGDAAIDLDAANRLIVGNYATPPPPEGARAFAYPNTFHPGAAAPAAAGTIELGLGEERAGVDIAVQPVPTARVSGLVEGPRDAVAGLVLRLMPAGLSELATGGEAATTLVTADGRFTFLNVPRGTYVVDARRATTEFTLDTGFSSAGLPSPPGVTGGGSSQSGSFPSAPPGTGYITRSRGGPDVHWTDTTVVVDAADVTDLVVTLRRGFTLQGRMVFEGTTRGVLTAPLGRGGARPAGPPAVTETTTAPPPTLPVVYAEPADGDPTLGRPRSAINIDASTTDRFTIDGLKPGSYVLRVPMRADQFTIRSITIGSEDYTHKPFDPSAVRGLGDVVLTFTDELTSVDGRVRDANGPVTHAAAIAFPVEREQWRGYGFSPARIRAAPIAGTDAYAFRGLPAGEYFFIAVDPSLVASWQDPAFLEKAAAVATRVTLEWGASTTVDLQIARIK